ncbi:MAG: hypothetical protein H0U03_12155 [Actinobacteria bacterium]|nr:hypothetical protein [Actinomycetota bacterium]
MARVIAGALSLDGAPISDAFVRGLATPPAGALAYDVRTWAGDGAHLAQTTFCEPSGGSEAASPAQDENTGCALVLSGHIDNADDLLDELGSRAARGLAERYGESGCVLASYLRWGRTAAARFIGEFAVALWDPRTRKLLLACDHVASRPLYHAVSRGRFIFASTAAQLFGAGVAREVDETAAVTFLYRLDRDFRSFHRGVDTVPAAHTVEVGAGRIELYRHWDWPSRPPATRVASGVEIEELRGIFTEAVRCRLARREPMAVPLSGGMDSSSVAAVAGGLAGRGDLVAPRVYSWIWRTEPSVDEARYSAALAERHGLDHVLIPADRAWPYSEVDRWRPFLTDPYLPPHDALWRLLLERARLDGARAVSLTTGADQLISGSPDYLADWVARGHWLSAAREARARIRAGSSRAALRGLVLPFLPLAAQRWRRREAAGFLEQMMPSELARRHASELPVPAITGPSGWWEALRGAVGWSGLGRSLAYHDRLAILYGLEFSHPYLDRRVVDFVLRAPPDLFYAAGRTKTGMRNALHDLLPPLVRDRTDKPNPYPWLRRVYRERLAPRARALAADSELERRGLVTGEPLRQFVERYIGGDDRLFPVFWYSFVVEVWLRQEAGRLDLSA